MANRTFSLCTTLALLTAAPLLAAEHTYPASMCVVVNSTDERHKPVYDDAGQLLNGSSSRAMEVVCPVVGPYDDLSVHPDPNATPGANVFVTDRHASEGVCCRALVNNVGAVASSQPACSQGIDSRFQTLNLDPPVANGTFTSRFFVCTIPPMDGKQMSGILLYRY